MIKAAKRPCILDSYMRNSRQIEPDTLSITLNLDNMHTASMTIAGDNEAPEFHDFVRLYTTDGDAGVFRVSSFNPQYGEQTQIVLQHASCTLNDDIIPGEEEYTGTLASLMSQFMAFQSGGHWRLGSVASTQTITIENGNKRLLDAIREAVKADGTTYLTFDTSSYPWTIGAATLSSTVSCEGRFSRNMEDCDVYINDSELYTRVYLAQKVEDKEEVTEKVPVTVTEDVPKYTVKKDENGKDVLDAYGDVVLIETTESVTTTFEKEVKKKNVINSSLSYYEDAAAVSKYGVISYLMTVPERATVDSVAEVAYTFLDAHKEPEVSIEINIVDLSKVTGESIDHFTLGSICRACIPECDYTINERITSIEYTDVISSPTKARVTMANKRPNVADFLLNAQEELAKLGGGVGGLKNVVKDQEDAYNELVAIVDNVYSGLQLESIKRQGLEQAWAKLQAKTKNVESSLELFAKEFGDYKEAWAKLQAKTEELESSVELYVSDIEGVKTAWSKLISKIGDAESGFTNLVTVDGLNTTLENKSYVSKGDLESATEHFITTDGVKSYLEVNNYVTTGNLEAGMKSVIETDGFKNFMKNELTLMDESGVTALIGQYSVPVYDPETDTYTNFTINKISGDVLNLNHQYTNINTEYEKINTKYQEINAEYQKINTKVSDIDSVVTKITGTINAEDSAITAKSVVTDGLGTRNFYLDEQKVSTTNVTIVTDFTQALGEEAPTTDYVILTTKVGMNVTYQVPLGMTMTF